MRDVGENRGAAQVPPAIDKAAGSSPASRGPWRTSMGRTVVHIIAADGHGVCSLTTTGFKGMNATERNDYRARVLADANVIAAAPSTAEAASKMLGALEEVRAIIKDAAMAGFNIESGNWPERLFASQQITKAAVDAATAAGIKSPLPEPQSGEHP